MLAQWSSRLLVRALSTATNTVFLDLSLDWRILGFTAAVALMTTVLFGMAPALRATQVQPNDALKAQGRGAIGDGHGRFGPGPVLIVMQVALSLVLVVAAGLFIRTFSSLAGVRLGFDSRPALVASIEFPGARIDQARRAELFRQLAAAAAAVPRRVERGGIGNDAARQQHLEQFRRAAGRSDARGRRSPRRTST